MLPAYFSTFPVNGKKPLIDWKEFQERLATEEEKDVWSKRYPSHGLGVVCGPISRLFVLDVDGPAGRASLEALETKFGPLPRTPTQTTPRADGGKHFCFRWVDELDERVTTKADILPGLDVRGLGGFIAFYGWELSPLAVPFAYPPQWLIDVLPRKGGGISVPAPAPVGASSASVVPPAEGSKAWLSEKLNGLKEGNRNQTFTSIAGRLRRDGYKSEDILALLAPKAREINFPESELRTLCNSVGRYAAAASEGGTGDEIGAFLADRVPVEWICHPILARNAIAFFAGLPETQKTWLMLDFAIEAARGGSWLGLYPVEKSRVVFIDQERPKAETQRRLAAMMKGKGLSLDALSGQLFARCGSSIKIDLQHSFEAFKKYLAEREPDVVIVDSLATFHQREESNRMEIQFVLEKVKELRDMFGCSFIFLHHETKNAFQSARDGQPSSYLDMAGNVAIPAAAEHVFNMRRQDASSCFLYHTKNNLGNKIPALLTRVTDLDPEKSAIAVEAR